MSNRWWRVKTTIFGSDAHGYMKMALFDNWTLLEMESLRLTQLFEYSVTSDFVRD